MIQKEEHRLLADYGHLFTDKLLKLARKSLSDPTVEKPSFMLRLPGVFQATKHGISYTSTTDNVTRRIVPREKR